MTSEISERVPFRVVAMECCGTILCCVNPRFYNYCPECGTNVMGRIRSWITDSDMNARLTSNLKNVRGLSAKERQAQELYDQCLDGSDG